MSVAVWLVLLTVVLAVPAGFLSDLLTDVRRAWWAQWSASRRAALETAQEAERERIALYARSNERFLMYMVDMLMGALSIAVGTLAGIAAVMLGGQVYALANGSYPSDAVNILVGLVTMAGLFLGSRRVAAIQRTMRGVRAASERASAE